MSQYKCASCNGRGGFAPARPSCQIDAAERPWIVVERCDTCDQFKDDLTAALSLFRIAGWFQCNHGGWHALADARTAVGHRKLRTHHARRSRTRAKMHTQDAA